MKKMFPKFLIILSLLLVILCGYKYSQKKIVLTKQEMKKNIPVKINIYSGNSSFGDSILVYLPYKFKIENNRLRRIGITAMYFKQMKDFYSNQYTLFFEEDGTPFGDFLLRNERRETLENLLREKKFIKYFKLDNSGIIFPFTKKSIYYYKVHKLSKSVFNKKITIDEYIKIAENFREKEVKNLYAEAPISIPKKIIDSLYESDRNENLFFIFKKNTKRRYGNYRITYKLSNEEQKCSDYYDFIKNMNKEQLYKYASKPVYEE